MRSIRSGSVWVLMAVVAGVLAWAIQGDPAARGPSPAVEQGSSVVPADQPQDAPIQPKAAPPIADQLPDDGMIRLRLRDLEAETIVRIVAEATPVDREKMFAELKGRHAAKPLDMALLLPLSTLRADEQRRDDVRAIGDWARRQIETHADREFIVGPILTHALGAERGVEGALLDVLDDHGRMRPQDIEAARAAFLHEDASYRLKRTILLLLPSVAQHALPMVRPLAMFRHEVVSGKAMAEAMRPKGKARKGPGGYPIHVPSPQQHHRAGGYQREHLEVQIDGLFEQIGAPALRELVTAYSGFLANHRLGTRAAGGWTVYDDAIIANASLDVPLVLDMALRMDPRERRLAAQALRDLEAKTPDVERALEKLRNDTDRLVREFAARR